MIPILGFEHNLVMGGGWNVFFVLLTLLCLSIHFYVFLSYQRIFLSSVIDLPIKPIVSFEFFQGLRGILEGDMITYWENLYQVTDSYTDKWLSSGKSFLLIMDKTSFFSRLV